MLARADVMVAPKEAKFGWYRPVAQGKRGSPLTGRRGQAGIFPGHSLARIRRRSAWSFGKEFGGQGDSVRRVVEPSLCFSWFTPAALRLVVRSIAEQCGQPERRIGRFLKSPVLGRRRVTANVSRKDTPCRRSNH
jgi:hypothetical protein